MFVLSLLKFNKQKHALRHKTTTLTGIRLVLPLIFLFNMGLQQMPLFAQLPEHPIQPMVRATWTGDPYTLRDIATYLDDPEWGEDAERALRSLSLFTKEEFDWSKPVSKQRFFDFFYPNKERIYLDPDLHLYLITPIERQATKPFLIRPIADELSDVQTRLNTYFQAAESATETVSFQEAAEEIAWIGNAEAMQFLLDFSEKKKDSKPFDTKPILAKTLQFCTDDRALLILENWLQNDQISPSDLEIPLSTLLNVFIPNVQKDSMLALIKEHKTVHKTLPSIKKAGLHEVSGLRSHFFEDSVDYYGLVMGKTGAQPWAKENAARKLIEMHHPKALYYLAAQVYHRRNYIELYQNKIDALQPALGQIEALTNLRLFVENEKGDLTDQEIDAAWTLNFIRYWAKHYDDYIWDGRKGIFVNKIRAETVRETAQNLFRQMQADSDSLALSAFYQLSEMDSSLTIPILSEQRNLGQAVHPVLSNLRHDFLDNALRFAALCKTQKEQWIPKPKLQHQLDTLRLPMLPFDRLKLENQLIRTLQESEIPALEFSALAMSSQVDYAMSISRILDFAYGIHFQKILENEEKTRYFLQKSLFFNTLNASGSCKRYHAFLGLCSTKQLQKFHQLKAETEDGQLKNYLEKTLSDLEPSTPQKQGEQSKTEEGQKQLEADLARIEKKQTVGRDELGLLLRNPYFEAERHLHSVLALLPKLSDHNHALLLDFNEKLSAKSHLAYFQNLELSDRTLSELTRIFKGDYPLIFFDFYEKKTKNKIFEVRGQILTQAFSVHWMVGFLMETQTNLPESEAIKAALRTYQERAEYLSEFEENQLRFLLLLLETQGRPLAEKLEVALQNAMPYRTEQQLLAYAQWEDLPSLAPYIAYLQPSPQGQPGYLFLNRDFGLPPLEYDKDEVFEAFFPKKQPERHTTYRKALIDFGLLDAHQDELPQLYHILLHERISPFVGSGGFFRDWGVFAAVKLLENRFGETFGFHEKLNENQTFYIFNSGARAQRWITYLEGNGLVGKKSISWQ